MKKKDDDNYRCDLTIDIEEFINGKLSNTSDLQIWQSGRALCERAKDLGKEVVRLAENAYGH